MTAALALVPNADNTCPVCDGDPEALFAVSPWGFHEAQLARCPLCLPDEGSCRVWREVLGPFLGDEA